MILDHYLNGAYYPKGGSGAFRDAFLGALRNHNTEMKNNARVVKIDKKGNEFFVKTESGETYTTQVVVSDADPVITLGKLINPQIVPSKIRKKVQFLRPSVGAFYAFIGTDLNLPSLGITDANIHHFDDIDINKIYDTVDASLLSEHVPAFFITSPSLKDPEGGHAPKGRHTVEIVTMVDYDSFSKWAGAPSMKRAEDYKSFKDRIGERLIEAAERHIPGLSEHLDHVEYASPLSNEYRVNAAGGGCYGPEQTPDQMGPGRFGSFTAGVEGLFLVGAGTLGGGIMPCVASGVLAGGKAAKHIGSSG